MRATCPECGEEVIETVPETLVNFEAHGIEQPRWSHLDGSPLCPVIGPHGYRPASPREEEDTP